MKKILIAIVVILVLVFAADKIYQIYSRSNVNSHEAVVLINNKLAPGDVDAFFNLALGTYDANQHAIVFSLLKKEAYLLDTYYNLPVKTGAGYPDNAFWFDCKEDYQEVRHYGFYNYEVASGIIARIVPKNGNWQKQLSAEEAVAEKHLAANFEFGEMSVFDVDSKGVVKRCEE